MKLEPIGIFRSHGKFPYDVPRQGVLEESQVVAEIELNPNHDFEQALSDLDGFDRIWLLYQFHHNTSWKPKTLPPRGPHIKRGVFATRSPYRPNPIGLSCVRLKKIEGRKLYIQEFDLLDGTPILDIKPYIPYADSFPEAKTGWLEEVAEENFKVAFSAEVESSLQFLEKNELHSLRSSLLTQLAIEPLDTKRKRVTQVEEDLYCLAYRTWRIDFKIDPEAKLVSVVNVRSGYSAAELADSTDPYADKTIHLKFIGRLT